MATTIVCDKMAEILFLFVVGPTHTAGFILAGEDFDLVMY
jgi:hypothetical protein